MSSSDAPAAVRIGSEEVRACLRELYTRLREDRMVGFFFAGRDVEAIVEGQVALVLGVLGEAGEASAYAGRSLPDAHRELPILPGHFDRRHTVLREVLEARGIDEKARSAWLAADHAWRKAILAAGAEARARAQRAHDVPGGSND